MLYDMPLRIQGRHDGRCHRHQVPVHRPIQVAMPRLRPSGVCSLAVLRRPGRKRLVRQVTGVLLVYLQTCAAAVESQHGLVGQSFEELRLEALKRAELLTSYQQQQDSSNCHKQTSDFLLRACVPLSSADAPADWDAGPASRPTTLDRMRASVELARCEVEAAGITSPAECQELPLASDVAAALDFTNGASTYRQLIRRCIESLSRSPQLWTSYVTASREFDTHCTKLQQVRGVDQARDLWRTAMEENAHMIRSVQRAMLDWSSVYSGQTERMDELTRNIKHDMEILLSWLTDMPRQSEAILKEHMAEMFHAAQQAQVDVLGASEDRSRELAMSVRTALEQQMEAIQVHLASLQLAAVETLERKTEDLLGPVKDDARSLSAELHILRLATMDVGTDLMRAKHGMRDLATSVESLQASTQLVHAELTEISRHSALATQSSERAGHAIGELEQVVRRRTTSMGVMLDRALGSRAVMLEAAIRIAVLYAPEFAKSLVIPVLSLSIRGVSSLAGLAALTLGHAVFGLLVWAIRLARRRHARRQFLEHHDKAVSGHAESGSPHCSMDETLLAPAYIAPALPLSEDSGFATPRPRTRALQYSSSLSNGFGSRASASYNRDHTGIRSDASNHPPVRALHYYPPPFSDGFGCTVDGALQTRDAGGQSGPRVGYQPGNAASSSLHAPEADRTPSMAPSQVWGYSGSGPVLSTAQPDWASISHGSTVSDWRSSVLDACASHAEASEVIEVEELV